MPCVVTDEEFSKYVSDAMDALHRQLADAKNVAIVIADEPTPEQREKLQLRGNQTLFGLYEGTPLTARHNGYTSIVPDKITLFKESLSHYVDSPDQLRREIHHTLWHELAHHFGLDHDQIHERE